MSALTNADIAELVRRRFNGPPGDELRYLPLVDSALRQLAVDTAKDANSRDWLMTDPASAVATLDAAGVADLTALIASPRILLDCLSYGDIYPPVDPNYSTQPFRLVDNSGALQLAGGYDSLIYKAHVDGFTLQTKSQDNNATPLVGDISFRVPYWPTMAQLPEPLVEKLVYGHYWSMAEQHAENE